MQKSKACLWKISLFKNLKTKRTNKRNSLTDWSSHKPSNMEQQIWDRRWENGYCFPFRNAETGRYYARDIYDGSIIPTSYSKSLRELRRKVRGYVSENLIQREAAFWLPLFLIKILINKKRTIFTDSSFHNAKYKNRIFGTIKYFV